MSNPRKAVELKGRASIEGYLIKNTKTPLYVVNTEGVIVFKLLANSKEELVVTVFEKVEQDAETPPEVEDVESTHKLKDVFNDPKFIYDTDRAFNIDGIKDFLGPE